MCCEQKSQLHHHQKSCDCGCNMFPRRFLSKKEQIAKMRKYVQSLKDELAGVETYIKELEKK